MNLLPSSSLLLVCTCMYNNRICKEHRSSNGQMMPGLILWWFSSLQFFYQMKKRDTLLEVIKKEEDYHLLSFLAPQDLLSLSLISKKYYALLIPTLQAKRLDTQQNTKKVKPKTQKSKNTKAKQEQEDNPLQTEVQIEKIPLHKFAKRCEKTTGQWRRLDKLQIFNSYLAKKIESKTAIFYRNTSTNQLIFINRSLVDPSLNYNKGGFGQAFLPNSLYQHIFTEGQLEQDFSSMQALLKRQKEVLEKINQKKEEERKQSEISYEQELQRAMSMRRLAIILCFGGSFSFGIFEAGRCLLHRSDRKYVCRQKAGERQFNRDKQSGSQIQSIGSQIRRDQEKKHVINVGEILKQNKQELAQCELILLQAPGLNRLFIINENQNLDGLQDRLRSVCVTAKKANFTEVQALFDAVSQVHVVRYLTPEQAKVKAKQRRQK